MKCSDKLPRSSILKVRADISRAFRKGIRYNGDYAAVIIVKKGIIRPPKNISSEDKNISQRMAVLVKKKCGKAHRRVRLKRIVREFYRTNRNLFPDCEAVLFSLESPVYDEKKFKYELSAIAQKYYESCQKK